MFIFDITMEDGRLLAESADGVTPYRCRAIDNFSGKSQKFFADPDQLTAIIALMAHPDGTPHDHEYMHKLVDPLFEGWPTELRLIP